MQDAVLDEDVGVDDAGGVDEHGAVGGDGDFELFAVGEGREFGVVAQRGAVADCALDDVVLKDLGELGGADVARATGDSLEGVVVGAENCYIRKVFERSDEAGLRCCAGEGGEVAGDQRGGDAEGDGQESVDDVDYAVVEFEVLDRVSVSDRG